MSGPAVASTFYVNYTPLISKYQKKKQKSNMMSYIDSLGSDRDTVSLGCHGYVASSHHDRRIWKLGQ